MKKFKKKGFTLIELIAVLVIMAILVLIVTPLVMNIIRKARISADKRSVDAYGRSIELAIAGYLLDTGKFATSIDELTIEYSGNKVECETTQINPDSSVYLSNCKVNNREVTNYTYGTDKSPSYEAYSVGDEVTYNGVDYYVLKDSGTKNNVVTLLKAEPLSVEEVNTYGAGHVNMNVPSSDSSYQTAYDSNGYGGMAYYTSETCGYIGTDWVYDGCKSDYASSEIKYVVDAWKAAKAPVASEARLISKDEYESMTTVETYETPTEPGTRYVPQYDWQYSNSYWYLTNTPYNDSPSGVWGVRSRGILNFGSVYSIDGVVRPVIVLPKSAL